MSDLNVTTISNSNIAKTDILLAFNNNDSKAATIQDVVQLVPGKMAVATCSTAGNVATKAVTCDDWNNKPGQSILVEFSNANSADNVTLSINSGTAIPVYYMNTATEQISGGAIPAGAVVFTLNAAGNKFYAHVTKLIEGAGVKIDGSKIEAVNDLPTDAVLHYSFDDLPDYPDGSADVRLLDNNTYDIQSTNYRFNNNDGVTYDNNNGNLHCSMNNTYFYLTYNNIYRDKIFKCKIKVTNIFGSLIIHNGYENIVKQIDQVGTYEVCFINTNNQQFPNIYFYCQGIGYTCTFDVLEIYCGDGSYATPVIDNANGKWNSVSQSGIAVQGVSGKGVKQWDSRIEMGNFNLNDNFTISIWGNPENNTTGKLAHILRKDGQFILRNGTINIAQLQAIIIQNNQSTVIGGSLLSANTWQNLVVIKDNLQFCIYINGIRISQTTLSQSSIDKNDNVFYIGGYDNNNPNTRPQSYDDLQIFDRALTEKEVLALYYNKANTPKYFSKADYLLEQIANNS